MNNRPKRRKKKDNPYTIIDNNGKYEIEFKDSSGFVNHIEISKNLFEEFNKFELYDLRELNEYDRHIEHLEYTEESLYNKTNDKEDTLENIVIKKIEYEKLYKAIEQLPKNQSRRIKLYYFNELTLTNIAKIEKCSIHSVYVSIERAKENLKKIIN